MAKAKSRKAKRYVPRLGKKVSRRSGRVKHNISAHGSPGMSIATIRAVENKWNKIPRHNRLTDLGKKAHIDKTPDARHWLKDPSRNDIVGIDARVTVKRK